MESNKHTIVIEAVYCCGKSYICSNHLYRDLVIRDIDEEIYPSKICAASIKKIQQEMGIIKDCLGNTDFVLSAVRNPILEFLRTHGIPYILVYPELNEECYREWEKRNIARGTSEFWGQVKNTFYTYVERVSRDRHAIAHIRLNKDQYLTEVFDQILSIAKSLK